jgi:hypothetical protein
MPRRNQGRASRGSQKWLQILVNEHPEIINEILADRINFDSDEHIRWLSPLEHDNYAEYRDQQFLNLLGIRLEKESLSSFWPGQGPCWDGLARTDRDKYVLVEAKSHIPELVTDPSGAKGTSLTKIRKSLAEVKWDLRSGAYADWATCFYQYTNRLAHLYLLRELNGLQAYLLSLYFINDEEQSGPGSQAQWEGAIKLMEAFLGLQEHKLSAYVLHAFVDVRDLQAIDA